jgi:hypothetical protein
MILIAIKLQNTWHSVWSLRDEGWQGAEHDPFQWESGVCQEDATIQCLANVYYGLVFELWQDCSPSLTSWCCTTY